jgi:ketosteroid isomerase-like protein
MSPHVTTVQQIYAAFGRGDVPFILALLADDVEWEYATFPNPVPWLQPLRGRDQVPRFFQTLAEMIEFHGFVPKLVVGEGPTVVGLVDLDATVRSTGKRVVEVDEVHIWHFDDAGRVARFRHRADTRQHAMALEGD